MNRQNPKKKVMKLRFYVTVFLVDRRYGGPEEGGWWYDAGSPVDHPANRSFDDIEKAREYLDKILWPIIEKMIEDEGMYPIDSSISTGCYSPMITDGLPRHFPLYRPRYE